METWLFRIHRWIESSKEQHLFDIKIYCNIINVTLIILMCPWWIKVLISFIPQLLNDNVSRFPPKYCAARLFSTLIIIISTKAEENIKYNITLCIKMKPWGLFCTVTNIKIIAWHSTKQSFVFMWSYCIFIVYLFHYLFMIFWCVLLLFVLEWNVKIAMKIINSFMTN